MEAWSDRVRRATGAASRPRRLVALIAVAALAGGACASPPVPTPAALLSPASPGASVPTQIAHPDPTTASASRAPDATGSAATAGPGTPSTPGESGDAPLAPLPRPALEEPFAIGEALYDPGRMDVAVVSLLDRMGIGIYAGDGTAIRKGEEHEAGDPWLTEGEVRGLIAMGVEDLESAQEADPDASGGPYTLADLATALKPLLPQTTVASLADGYGRAYADHPNDLVPQVMLGQPIDAATPLTRVQLWLLYMDGFIGPAGSGVAGASDIRLAALQITWGTARSRLRQIPAFDPTLLPEEWRELYAHMPTLGDTMDFLVQQPGGVHEGHGRTGATATALAVVRRANPLVSAITGHVLLPARTGSLAGIPVTWRSRKPSVLRGHGTLDVSLPATTRTTDGGDAEVHYTPRREPANGVGAVAREVASLYATARRRDLVERTYVMAGPVLETVLAFQFNTLRTAAGQGFPVAWHDKGMELTLTNTFDVRIDTSPSGVEGLAHRKGTTTVSGVLMRQSDGTWRGTLDAGGTDTEIELDFATPLAGGTCAGADQFAQDLDVVATVQPRGTIDPNQFALGRGQFDGDDLVLRFYPAGPITTTGVDCLTPIGYRGPGPDGRPLSATYAQFNDARLTDPTEGFLVHTSDTGDLEYIDYSRQSAALQVESSWRIVVVPPTP